MAKKSGQHRIVVGLNCTKCNFRGYVTSRNKLNTEEKLTGIMKFCSICRVRQPHKEIEKLK